ncbi:MAG: hypothetical protein HY577_02275 [Candidatus Nealsonbacteria bacterium]|nr:hypothetical protein [Candidatus Nealsonbacteria bacterium]
MLKKNKRVCFQKNKLLLFFLLTGTLLASFVLAQKPLEITYPTIPLADTPSTIKTSLPAYLKYVFNFSLIAAGILIFLALLRAGFSRLTSVANPEGLKDSNDQLISAVIGTVLLLSSYIILNTLNPTLTVLKMPGARIAKEIHVWSNPGRSGNDMGLKVSNPDLPSTLGSSGVQYLEFVSTNADEVDVSAYPDVNYGGTPTKVTTPGNVALARSISLAWKIPGVYLHSGTSLGGEPRLYLFSQAAVADFNDRAQSIRLLNQGSNQFAAVLHKDQNFQGECAVVFNDQNSLNNEDATGGGVVGNNQTSSVTIFKPDLGRPASGSEGVTLFGKDSSRNKVGVRATNNKITSFPVMGVENDSVDEVQILGNYIAVLFENNNFRGKCAVFTKSDDNLSDDPIGKCQGSPYGNCFCIPVINWCVPCEGPCTSSFMVFPIKPF